MSRGPATFKRSESADTIIRVLADDLRRHLTSGLYRHFNTSGELLYVGETDNFLARSLGHLKKSRWRAEIHAIELQPMPKAEAQQLEPRVIAAELPRYNTKHHLENEAKAREHRARETQRAREENERRIVASKQQVEARRQELQAEAARRAELIKKWKFDASRIELAKTIRKRRAPWDGRLETYRSIYDAEPPA